MSIATSPTSCGSSCSKTAVHRSASIAVRYDVPSVHNIVCTHSETDEKDRRMATYACTVTVVIPCLTERCSNFMLATAKCYTDCQSIRKIVSCIGHEI